MAAADGMEAVERAIARTLRRKSELCLAVLKGESLKLEIVGPFRADGDSLDTFYYRFGSLIDQVAIVVREVDRGYVFAGLVFPNDSLMDVRPKVGVVYIASQSAWFTSCVLACTPISKYLTDQLEIIRRLWGWEIVPSPRRLNQAQVMSALRLMADHLRR